MQTHSTGPIVGARNGALLTVQTFPILFSDPTAVGKVLTRLFASTFQPLLIETKAVVELSSDAVTSHVIGVLAGGLTLLSGADFKASPNTTAAQTDPPVGPPNNRNLILTAEADVVMTPTIVGTVTQGKMWIILKIYELNVTEPSANR